MDHAYFIEKISAYFDRDLDPYELRVVEEHLETCQECRELFKKLEKLDTFVEENSSLTDDEYWERSARKIEAALDLEASSETTDIRPKSWKSLGWKLTAVAASFAALAFIGLHETELYDGIHDDNLLTAPSEAPKPTRPRKKIDSAQSLGRDAKKFHLPDTEEVPNRKTELIESVPPSPVKKSSAQAVQSAKNSVHTTQHETDALISGKDEEVVLVDLFEETLSSNPDFHADERPPLHLANQPAEKTKGVANSAVADNPSFMGAAEPELYQRSLLLRRDSLISTFHIVNLDSTSNTAENMSREMATKSVAEKSDSNQISPVFKLLEVQYLIGKSTPNRSAYDSVLVFMDSLQSYGDSAVSKKAANYLKLLKERNDW